MNRKMVSNKQKKNNPSKVYPTLVHDLAMISYYGDKIKKATSSVTLAHTLNITHPAFLRYIKKVKKEIKRGEIENE